MDGDAIMTQIKEVGGQIRQLKVDKQDFSDKLAELSDLKNQYKAATGEDYDAVMKARQEEERKAKKAAKVAAASGGGKGDGPSKSELKKQAKAAKKAANKEKKAAASGEAPASGGQAPAPGARSSGVSASSSGLELACPPNTPPAAVAKCLACAQALGVSLSVAPARDPALLSHAAAGLGLPLLKLPTQEIIFGANAICRYLGMASAAGSLAPPKASELSDEECFELEELELEPALLALQSAVASEAVVLPILHDTAPKENFLVDFDEYSIAYQYTMLGATAGAAAQGTAQTSLPPGAAKAFQSLTTALGALEKLLEASTGKAAGAILAVTLAGVAAVTALDAYPRCQGLLGSLQAVVDQAAAAGAAAAAPPVAAVTANVEFSGSLLEFLTDSFMAAIQASFPQLEESAVDRKHCIRRQTNAKFGDYQCNSPMELFKALKQRDVLPGSCKRPADVGQMVVDALPAAARDICSDVTVAPAGFVNLRISKAFAASGLQSINEKGPCPPAAKKRRVCVDFSSPNIAKEMHVGHLRSTIIGDTICRMLEYVGHEVHRINHVGDWGTQFGMLILYMKEAYPDFLNSPPNISDLTTFYKQAKKRFDEDQQFKEQARLTVVDLQAGDPSCRAVWQLLCDISRKEFDKVYARLGVQVKEFGESFYNSRIPGVIDVLQGVDGLVKQEGGAKCIFLEPRWSYPLFLQKSDGGFGYDSTDMAAIDYRLRELKGDWLIYVTDAGQAEHFFMVFEAAKRAGWIDSEKHRLDHVGFGVVQGIDGKRFKTRSGETVRLVDLLDEAVHRMRTSLDARVQEGKCQLGPEELDEAARRIGYGAVKYFDLCQNLSTNYKFSYDKMLDVKGDTAVYLMFAFARFSSIVRKGAEEFNCRVEDLVGQGHQMVVEDPSEVALALELLQLPDVVNSALADLLPHRLCEYLHHLSVKATAFVTNCKVLGTPEMQNRLLICSATCTVMRLCFELLGITPLDRI